MTQNVLLPIYSLHYVLPSHDWQIFPLNFFFFFFSSEYKEFIKFTKPSPIDEQQTKKEKKQKEGGKKKGKAQESGDAAAANAGEGIAKGIESMAVDQWCLLHMDS